MLDLEGCPGVPGSSTWVYSEGWAFTVQELLESWNFGAKPGNRAPCKACLGCGIAYNYPTALYALKCHASPQSPARSQNRSYTPWSAKQFRGAKPSRTVRTAGGNGSRLQTQCGCFGAFSAEGSCAACLSAKSCSNVGPLFVSCKLSEVMPNGGRRRADYSYARWDHGGYWQWQWTPASTRRPS